MYFFLTALVLLWLDLFWALVPTWRFGEYYAYGWFVPLLALPLACRRWRTLGTSAALPPDPPRPSLWVLILCAMALVCIAPLRLVEDADLIWRPPLLLHAIIVLGVSQLLLWNMLGRRVALGLLPVMVFALSSVPYPWKSEQDLIHWLTGFVVGLTHELFLLCGRPVELMGERLAMGSDMVDVTDGCSGIRSLQSLVMVALFFGEMLLLSFPRRLVLIAVAGICAVAVNTARAYCLAEIHFSRGSVVAGNFHDLVGNTAFLVSAALLFLATRLMLRAGSARRRVVVISRVSPS